MASIEKSMEITLRPPYLVFLGDEEVSLMAKTGFGLVQWRRELCAGQLRLPGCKVDLGIPDMTTAEAAAAGVRSLVCGVANVGGFVPENWHPSLIGAAEAGLDIVAGMHSRLADIPALAEAARKSGVRLVDVRVPPPGIPAGSGAPRSGRRLLTVGTDCAVGKKYTALSLEREMRARGMAVDFRATGQTGIMIAGAGMPIDAVVSDFISGAAELLSPDNDRDHWDVIEGQGSLFHPAYAAVSLGLLHGSQPDAIVLCHEAGRRTVDCFPGYPLPEIDLCIAHTLASGRLTSPDISCVGVSVNTSALVDGARQDYLQALGAKTGLPCVDPLAGGVGPIVDHILSSFGPA